MIKNEELMPFKKYVQNILRILYHDEIVQIKGTFKEIPSGKIIKNDIFEAHLAGKGSLEETYKAYIKWFNYTKYPNEEEREFVSIEKFLEAHEGVKE